MPIPFIKLPSGSYLRADALSGTWQVFDTGGGQWELRVGGTALTSYGSESAAQDALDATTSAVGDVYEL